MTRQLWYHGRARTDGPWQQDRGHPGVWLASTRRAAQWYVGTEGTVIMAELGHAAILNLNDPETFKILLWRTSLSHQHAQIRRIHARGNLYLLDEGTVQNALVAEAFKSHMGLVLRDRTDGHSHLSLVLKSTETLETRSERAFTRIAGLSLEKYRVRQR